MSDHFEEEELTEQYHEWLHGEMEELRRLRVENRELKKALLFTSLRYPKETLDRSGSCVFCNVWMGGQGSGDDHRASCHMRDAYEEARRNWAEVLERITVEQDGFRGDGQCPF